MYEAIRQNKQRTALIVMLFAGIIVSVFSLVGNLYWGSPLVGGVLGALIGGVYTFLSVRLSAYSLLKMTHAREIIRSETQDIKEVQLLHISEQLALMAGIPTPKVYVVPDSQPNAFAAGMRPEQALVAVTSGLLEQLSRSEIEAVVAHEIAHIQNYDSRLKVTVFAMGGFLVAFGRLLLRTNLRPASNKNGKDSDGFGMLSLVIGLVVYLLGMVVSQLMQLWVSRNREYLADATAVELTRNPQALITALEKISEMEKSDQADPSMATMYFTNPFKKERDTIWSTHPTTANRIARLKTL